MIELEWDELPLDRRSLLAEERRLRKQQPLGWAKQHCRVRHIIRGKLAEIKQQGKTITRKELSELLCKTKKEQGFIMRQNPPY